MRADGRTRRGICAAFAALAAAVAAAEDDATSALGWQEAGERPPPVVAMTVEGPRPFGYVVGDRIRHRVAVTIDDDARLQQASLPVRRRIGEWLELQTVAMAESGAGGGRRYVLTLTYQLFATPVEVDSRTIPPFTLRIARDGESMPITVPGWTFAQSPLLAGDIAREGENIVAMRAEMPPQPVSTGGLRAGLAAFVALAAIGGGWLAWLHAPAGRRRRPFARNCKALARLAREPLGEERLRAGYRLLHRGFDETAGHAVFAGDVAAFCREHPAFAAEREAIDNFFAESRQLFFDRGGPAPTPANWEALHAFARRCRDAERRTP